MTGRRLGRRALPALLLAPSAARAQGRELRRGAGPLRGAAQAAGALLWVHQHYEDGAPPDPPPFMARLTGADWDLWRFDRPPAPPGPGRDPLDQGAERLIAATTQLRAEGYRRIVLVGVSRGAFIALVALRHAPLADTALLIAPAAHGRRADRRAEALAAFRAACAAASPGTLRRGGLVLFADDPYDPDPAARASAFAAAMARTGAEPLVIDRPPAPTGHGAAEDPAFDPLYGARVARFLAG